MVVAVGFFNVFAIIFMDSVGPLPMKNPCKHTDKVTRENFLLRADCMFNPVGLLLICANSFHILNLL